MSLLSPVPNFSVSFVSCEEPNLLGFLSDRYRRILTIPFSSSRKMMLTVTEVAGAEKMLFDSSEIWMFATLRVYGCVPKLGDAKNTYRIID